MRQSLSVSHISDEVQLLKLDTCLADARRHVLDVVSQLRSAIGDLRSASLHTDFATALEQLVDQLVSLYGADIPHVTLKLDSATSLSAAVTVGLFRITREAVHNSVKHARATEVLVRLQIQTDAIELVIQDNGCGFEVPSTLGASAPTHHVGLIGIDEQVALAHGRWMLVSARDRGTTVYVWLPLRPV